MASGAEQQSLQSKRRASHASPGQQVLSLDLRDIHTRSTEAGSSPTRPSTSESVPFPPRHVENTLSPRFHDPSGQPNEEHSIPFKRKSITRFADETRPGDAPEETRISLAVGTPHPKQNPFDYTTRSFDGEGAESPEDRPHPSHSVKPTSLPRPLSTPHPRSNPFDELEDGESGEEDGTSHPQRKSPRSSSSPRDDQQSVGRNGQRGGTVKYHSNENTRVGHSSPSPRSAFGHDVVHVPPPAYSNHHLRHSEGGQSGFAIFRSDMPPTSSPRWTSSAGSPRPVAQEPYGRAPTSGVRDRSNSLAVNQHRRDSDETLHDMQIQNTAKGSKWGNGQDDIPDAGAFDSPTSPQFGGRPLKSALRRRTSAERTESAPQRQSDAARIASTYRGHPSHEADLEHGPSLRLDHYHQHGDHRTKGGVLSNLLKLYVAPRPALKRSASCTSAADNIESCAPSRASSCDSGTSTYHGRPGFRRTQSAASIASTVCPMELDPDDPRLREDYGKREPNVSKLVAASSGLAGPAVPVVGTDTASRANRPSWRRRASSNAAMSDEESVYDRRKNSDRRRSSADKDDGESIFNASIFRGISKRKRAKNIKLHVADIVQRQTFILKLAKALIVFGSPSHRLESQLAATARCLEIDAQFIHIPTIVIASFGDPDTHTSETHFVKAAGGLNLGQLAKVHEIYRQVVHDEIGVKEGKQALSAMLREKPIYSTWQRMLIAACCAGIISPLGFAGSFLDAWVSAAFGACLAFLQLQAASKNGLYSNIFEISIATLISFVARGLSTTELFCYQATSSAGVVLILPGYVILCGSLELASKNLIAGSVRMVYAIIYSLFLGFGIAIGSDFWYLIDPGSRSDNSLSGAVYKLSGTFSASNSTDAFSGTFTFTNGTDSTRSPAQQLKNGDEACYRDPSWPWYRQGVVIWWLFLLVPAFSFFLSLWNLQPIKSRHFPIMVIISCVGFVTNKLANYYIFDRSDVVSFLGSFVIGILGNLYSRLFRGNAFVAMVTGVLFLVPSGIAAAGGLAMTYTGSDGDSYTNGLTIGFRMVQVAIGITVGLFFSSFLIYSFGRKKGSALFAF